MRTVHPQNGMNGQGWCSEHPSTRIQPAERGGHHEPSQDRENHRGKPGPVLAGPRSRPAAPRPHGHPPPVPRGSMMVTAPSRSSRSTVTIHPATRCARQRLAAAQSVVPTATIPATCTAARRQARPDSRWGPRLLVEAGAATPSLRRGGSGALPHLCVRYYDRNGASGGDEGAGSSFDTRTPGPRRHARPAFAAFRGSPMRPHAEGEPDTEQPGVRPRRTRPGRQSAPSCARAAGASGSRARPPAHLSGGWWDSAAAYFNFLHLSGATRPAQVSNVPPFTLPRGSLPHAGGAEVRHQLNLGAAIPNEWSSRAARRLPAGNRRGRGTWRRR